MNKNYIYIGIAAILIILFISLYRNKNKKQSGTIQEGKYVIVNNKGLKLLSSAFTPVMCDYYKIVNSLNNPSHTEYWILKSEDNGFYTLYKPGVNECLHSSDGKNLKTFSLEGCKKKTVCGLEAIDEEFKEIPTNIYFRIIMNPDNSVYLYNVEFNRYVCLDNNVYLGEKSDNCKFYMKRV
jgi:hypothetical protein